jgi:RNA polymerase sigma-70 factor (ECF subfamily)
MGQSIDRRTLDRLVIDCLPEVLRFAVRLTGNPDTAEEVVQEALLRVSRSWRSFRGQSRFRTWLLRIVINAFHDLLAAESTGRPLPEEVADRRAADPSSGMLAEEFGQQVAARVSALPYRQREVLILSVYEGLTPREVAEVLKISEANVYSTLHIVRCRLRRELGAYLAEE